MAVILEVYATDFFAESEAESEVVAPVAPTPAPVVPASTPDVPVVAPEAPKK